MERLQPRENKLHLDVRQVEVEFSHSVCLGGVDSLEAGEEELVTRAVRLCVGAGQADFSQQFCNICIAAKLLPTT